MILQIFIRFLFTCSIHIISFLHPTQNWWIILLSISSFCSYSYFFIKWSFSILKTHTSFNHFFKSNSRISQRLQKMLFMYDFIIILVWFIRKLHLVLSSNYSIWKSRLLFKSVNFFFYLCYLEFFVLISFLLNSFFHILLIILKASFLRSNSHANLLIDSFDFLFRQIIFLNLFS